jgi:uncharacterized membrane protein YgdD (TMEM256/DUF423 family)
VKPNWIAIGALSGALAVVLGAFGAHALKSRVGPDELEIWKTAVQYQATHALALVFFGLFRERRATSATPGWCFLTGSAIFSGTLYGLALGGPRVLGAVTPIGGVLFIAGWILFAVQALRAQPAS